MFPTFRIIVLACSTLCALSPSSAASSGVAVSLTKRSNLTKRNTPYVTPAEIQGAHSRIVGKLYSGLKAYERNTGSPHPIEKNVNHAFNKRQSIGDLQVPLWVGTISVSQPPQALAVEFDTSSSDVVLRRLVGSSGGGGAWDPNDSLTAINTNKDFQIILPTGEFISGTIFNDSLTASGLTAPQQPIGAATEFEFGNTPANFSTDGVVGLAFPALSQLHLPSFLSTLQNHSIIKPQFAFSLGGTAAELFLGGVNPARFIGPIFNISIINPSFWEIELNEVGIFTQQFTGTFIPQFSSAVIDTFSPFVVGDNQTITQIHKLISGSQDASATFGPGYFTVPCATNAVLGLQFLPGPVAIQIPFANWNLGPVASGSTICVSALIADNLGVWVIGEPIMRTVYTVFDMQANTVGFAELS